VAKVKIRRLRKKDASDIVRIDAAITKTGSTLDLRRIVGEEVKRATDASFVAEFDGKVVGYMITYITSGNFGLDKCAWIAMFGVDPKHMGRGIGKSLGEEIFEFYKDQGVTDVFTTVKWDSTDLLSFFKTLGFDRSDFINLRKEIG
jgi:ribosomal protein S18 acetylase RimI-like enzyme